MTSLFDGRPPKSFRTEDTSEKERIIMATILTVIPTRINLLPLLRIKTKNISRRVSISCQAGTLLRLFTHQRLPRSNLWPITFSHFDIFFLEIFFLDFHMISRPFLERRHSHYCSPITGNFQGQHRFFNPKFIISHLLLPVHNFFSYFFPLSSITSPFKNTYFNYSFLVRFTAKTTFFLGARRH